MHIRGFQKDYNARSANTNQKFEWGASGEFYWTPADARGNLNPSIVEDHSLPLSGIPTSLTSEGCCSLGGKRAVALRAKYSGALNGDPPHFVGESDWRLFVAHVRDGRSLQEISRETGLSAFKVGVIISQVDRDLETPRPARNGQNAVTPDSPLEDLELSMRARNALHEIGCVTVGDVLEKDFTRAVRRFGPVTKQEITALLRQHGFAVPPTLMDGSTSRIFELRRDLARLRDSIEDTTRRLRKHLERLEHRLNKM